MNTSEYHASCTIINRQCYVRYAPQSDLQVPATIHWSFTVTITKITKLQVLPLSLSAKCTCIIVLHNCVVSIHARPTTFRILSVMHQLHLCMCGTLNPLQHSMIFECHWQPYDKQWGSHPPPTWWPPAPLHWGSTLATTNSTNISVLPLSSSVKCTCIKVLLCFVLYGIARATVSILISAAMIPMNEWNPKPWTLKY